jgi:hypothetical protein
MLLCVPAPAPDPLVVSVAVGVLGQTLVVDLESYERGLVSTREAERGEGRTTSTLGAARRLRLVDGEEERLVRVDRESSAANDSGVVLRTRYRSLAPRSESPGVHAAAQGRRTEGTYQREDLNGVGHSAHSNDLQGLDGEGILSLELHHELEPLETGRLLQVGGHESGLASLSLDDGLLVVGGDAGRGGEETGSDEGGGADGRGDCAGDTER